MNHGGEWAQDRHAIRDKQFWPTGCAFRALALAWRGFVTAQRCYAGRRPLQHGVKGERAEDDRCCDNATLLEVDCLSIDNLSNDAWQRRGAHKVPEGSNEAGEAGRAADLQVTPAARVIEREKHAGKPANALPREASEQQSSEPRGYPHALLRAEALCALAAVEEDAIRLSSLAEEQQPRRDVPRARAEHLHVERTHFAARHPTWSACDSQGPLYSRVGVLLRRSTPRSRVGVPLESMYSTLETAQYSRGSTIEAFASWVGPISTLEAAASWARPLR
eukprot:scaffold286540_cov36-Tisochrysis_lutea.AAC.1